MTSRKKIEETRWQVIKALLDEFPSLREKAKEYLNSKADK